MKQCSQCGYFSENSDDVKCPICKGSMIETVLQTHNAKVEKEWNNGYHNDFAEGRKTGDYCDRKFEINLNGGRHIESKPDLMHVNKNTFIKFLIIAIFFFLFPPAGIFLFYILFIKPNKNQN